MVQEPYTSSHKPSLLGKEGYTLLHVDNYISNVRAALLVRNTLQAWRVDGLCTSNITVAVIVVKKGRERGGEGKGVGGRCVCGCGRVG